MKTKYLDDYVDYMQELYPDIERKAILEMMEDSFDIVRRMLRNERVFRVMKRKSALFGDNFPGTYKLKTIYSRIQGFKVINKLNSKRRKIEDDKSINK